MTEKEEQIAKRFKRETAGVAQRDAEIVAWLGKKAREYSSAPERQESVPDAIARLASKIARGAVRQDNVLGAATSTEDAAVLELRAEVGRLAAERDAYCDRVDTITAVARGNKRHVQEMYADLQKAHARVTELETAAKAPAELTVWRAAFEDGITLGHYANRQAAMDHVHATLANEEGGDVTTRVIWRADDPEADEPEWECWLFDTDMADDTPTGYVVTPLTVASAYDAEADE